MKLRPDLPLGERFRWPALVGGGTAQRVPQSGALCDTSNPQTTKGKKRNPERTVLPPFCPKGLKPFLQARRCRPGGRQQPCFLFFVGSRRVLTVQGPPAGARAAQPGGGRAPLPGRACKARSGRNGRLAALSLRLCGCMAVMQRCPLSWHTRTMCMRVRTRAGA